MTKSALILDDNSQEYINFLSSAIEHADPEAETKINRRDRELIIVVIPSNQDFKESLIKNILSIHKILNLTSDFSKSTKISKSIYFRIDFANQK